MGAAAQGKTLETPGIAVMQQVRHWHKAMARFAVAAGRRPGELARAFGITYAHASRVLASPLFQAEMGRLEALADYEAVDMRTELEMRLPKTLEVVDNIFDLAETDADGNTVAVPPALRLKKDLAMELWDRTGYGKSPEVQKHLHLHKHDGVEALSDEELDRRIEAKLSEMELDRLTDTQDAEIVEEAVVLPIVVEAQRAE